MYNHQSKYCYPNSDVYINKLNIRDPKVLENAEIELTMIRSIELRENPIVGNWDLNHLKEIHKYIFQDIYPFAGKIREENIAKGNFQFANYMYIESMAKKLFQDLKSEKYLEGLKKESICERLSYYLSEINALHPFREGNGRTQREFIRTLALKNGYSLDWSKVDKETLMNAFIQSTVDTKPLENLLNEIIPEQEPDKQLIQKWKTVENELEL